VELGKSARTLSGGRGLLVVQNDIQSLYYGKYVSLDNRHIKPCGRDLLERAGENVHAFY
jgi:hypothetical protein